ncbi:MAG TPA: prolyl oligopeptidase family serine peptidase [Gemmataceae bacterium]|nr:prolyl oligopeptidase family serine peptidase [Gemmataceae bacterium]
MVRIGSCFAMLLCGWLSARAGDIPPLPKTPKKAVTETFHGVTVTDDYRWLDNAADPAVRQWTEAENKHTRAVLDRSPALKPLRKRLRELLAHASPGYFGLQMRGGTLFALKSQPPKEQPFLVTLKSADDPDSAKVLLDPNMLSSKGKTAIDFYVPSRDGRLVAVSLSQNGSEEGTVHVYEAATGKELADVVPRVQYPTAGGDVAWDAGNTGFYYTRYPRGSERPRKDLHFYEQVYFHKLGTATDQDTYVLGKDFPRIAEIFLDTSTDGRFLLATVQNGDGGEFEHFLRDSRGKWTQLTHFADQVSAAAFDYGTPALYLLSLKDAPRGKILRLPLTTPDLANAETVVKESDVVIQGLRFGSNRLYTTFVPTVTGIYVGDVNGGPSQMRFFDRDGGLVQTVPLPPVSSVREVVHVRDDRVLIHGETYVAPPAWYAFNKRDKQLRRTALFRTSPADFSDTEVVREFATSRDGTKVPLNILRRKGTRLDGTNPTLLTGYGGFGISQSPSFSAGRRVWLDQGGVYAIANLRGGGEYGEAWHKAGYLTHKQNVFDDFAACAKHLIDRGYTSRDKLAIEGGSNGGLLMGAELTQHPHLFRAVVSHVGIYDMLRFERFPNGVFNVTEYGSIKDPEQFQALYAYSPYQHVKDGTAYPAAFLLTGANDGRVDPANSRKMAARLQAATTSKRPVLLLVDFGSGHGIGDNLSAAINRAADVYAFLFNQLGMKYQAK